MRSEFLDNDMRETFISEVERLSSDEHIIGLYNAEIEDEIMKNAIREHSKEIGYKEGHEQGIQQGIKEGIKEGIEQNKIEVIINMIKENIDVSVIAKVVGLPIEKIQKYVDENTN